MHLPAEAHVEGPREGVGIVGRRRRVVELLGDGRAPGEVVVGLGAAVADGAGGRGGRDPRGEVGQRRGHEDDRGDDGGGPLLLPGDEKRHRGDLVHLG